VTAETRRAVTLDGAVIGLPCCNVTNLLLYRRDQLDRYSLPVPQTWGELKKVGHELQSAVRRDGNTEFFGFATRGAGGGGHSVWSVSTFLASFGARWLSDESTPEPIGEAHASALSTYLDLVHTICPPDQAAISFVELMRDFRNNRVGMIMEVGMEYANLFRDNSELAERSGVALVPAGPAGRRPNLYSPPWAIPAKSKVREEAWQLAKFLSSSRQLLEDGVQSGAVETSSLSALSNPQFDRRFRPDLLSAVRQSRAVAFEERPFGKLGIEACIVVGDAVNAAVEKRAGVKDTLERIHGGLKALAPR
jgi:ABC-type glycerol-3-phosphate transport system substrate-binding protein